MKSPERENSREILPPPRDDVYDFSYFSPEQSRRAELLAKQIQAQSYLNMRFVRPEGLLRLNGGVEILAPDVDKPTAAPELTNDRYTTEYVIGLEKGSCDLDPKTGNMLTWKKYYAPLDALPAYHFCKDVLDPGEEEKLRAVEPERELVEIEAMGKTINAGPHAIVELMRNELQRVILKHASGEAKQELWYFNIVDTTYQAFIKMWGPHAVRKIGTPKRMDNPNVYDHIQLVPAVIDVENFFSNMITAIRIPDNPYVGKQLRNFLYMTSSLDDSILGRDVAAFRQAAIIVITGTDNR